MKHILSLFEGSQICLNFVSRTSCCEESVGFECRFQKLCRKVLVSFRTSIYIYLVQIDFAHFFFCLFVFIDHYFLTILFSHCLAPGPETIPLHNRTILFTSKLTFKIVFQSAQVYIFILSKFLLHNSAFVFLSLPTTIFLIIPFTS